jgi:hypothetical protein
VEELINFIRNDLKPEAIVNSIIQLIITVESDQFATKQR